MFVEELSESAVNTVNTPQAALLDESALFETTFIQKTSELKKKEEKSILLIGRI